VVVITGSGLDANNVASLITGAARSNAPLPPNSQGNARLAMRVAEAAHGSLARFATLLQRHAAHMRHRRARATTLAMR